MEGLEDVLGEVLGGVLGEEAADGAAEELVDAADVLGDELADEVVELVEARDGVDAGDLGDVLGARVAGDGDGGEAGEAARGDPLQVHAAGGPEALEGPVRDAVGDAASEGGGDAGVQARRRSALAPARVHALPAQPPQSRLHNVHQARQRLNVPFKPHPVRHSSPSKPHVDKGTPPGKGWEKLEKEGEFWRG